MSKVFDIIEAEESRQENTVELIASENFVSEDIRRALGSVLTNKYTEGYPPLRYADRGSKGRYYGGCQYYDQLEEYCCDLWRKVYGTDYHVNVQPHSGSQANMAAYAAFLKPGDTILAMRLNAGGHLTHSAPVSFVTELYNVVTYGVDENGIIDYKEIEEKIIKYKPSLILFGASSYSRELDFGYLNDVVEVAVDKAHLEDSNLPTAQNNNGDDYYPIIMVDMAHIAGLVATGYHSTPFGFADVITTTTHKTLRGPRGGLIFCKPEFAAIVDKAVFPHTQGGSLMNVIAAKAICAEEALRPEFKTYIKNVIDNCRRMALAFQDLGYKIVSGGTDNHLFLLDLTGTGVTGKELQEACDMQNITLNKNAIPNDPLPPGETSGVRIGTAAMTTKGWTSADFITCAQKIDKIIKQIKAGKKAKITLNTALYTVEQLNKKAKETVTFMGYPIDPHPYKDIEIWKNVTVVVSENMDTGEISLSWKRQPNTEQVDSLVDEE